MDPLDTGLRFRLRRAARQIGQQHQHLREVLASLQRSLGDGAPPDAMRDQLDRYREALDAHFSLENDVLFPALHGLRPEHTGELEVLEAEHVDFSARLGRMGELLRGALRAEVGAALDGFARDMAAHDVREERLARVLSDWQAEEA